MWKIILPVILTTLLYSQNDITEYKNKIKPNKEYEIEGQDILNAIDTIDSLEQTTENLINKLHKLQKEIEFYKVISVKGDIADTVYLTPDTVYIHRCEVTMDEEAFWIIVASIIFTIIGVVSIIKLVKGIK